MSFEGVVEARCPAGCAPFEALAWTVVHGDRDPELKEILLGGEFNLLSCPACDRVFYFEHTVVYMDLGRELLAFIYPEAYRKQKSRWQAHAKEDFARYNLELSASGGRGIVEPALFFGLATFQAALREEEGLFEETAVAEALARERGLEVFAVSPGWARRKAMPDRLPLARGGTLRERVTAGVKALLEANDRLVRYARLLASIEKDAAWEDPPERLGAASPRGKRR